MREIDGGPISLPRQEASAVFPMERSRVEDAFHQIVSFPIGLQEEAPVIRQLSSDILTYIATRTFLGFSERQVEEEIRPSYRMGILAAHRTAVFSADVVFTSTGVGALPPEVTMSDIKRHEDKVAGSAPEVNGDLLSSWGEAWKDFEVEGRYADFARRMKAVSAIAPLEVAFKGAVMDFAGWIEAKAVGEFEAEFGSLQSTDIKPSEIT